VIVKKNPDLTEAQVRGLLPPTSPATSSPRWSSSAPNCPRRRWARSCAASCAKSRQAVRPFRAAGGDKRFTAISARCKNSRAVLEHCPTRPATRQAVAAISGRASCMAIGCVGACRASARWLPPPPPPLLIDLWRAAHRVYRRGWRPGFGVKVGDVVVATEFRAARHGRLALFPRYEVPLYGLSRFACDPALSTRPRLFAPVPHGCWAAGCARAARPQASSWPVASGDRFVATTDESRIQRLRCRLAWMRWPWRWRARRWPRSALILVCRLPPCARFPTGPMTGARGFPDFVARGGQPLRAAIMEPARCYKS
jgi:hypothetical protein